MNQLTKEDFQEQAESMFDTVEDVVEYYRTHYSLPEEELEAISEMSLEEARNLYVEGEQF